MIVVLLGAPDCGKTTQAARLASALGLARVHADDLRYPGQSDDELAESVADLAADARTQAGMTLEGFPTTVAQAQALDAALAAKGMKLSTVIYIDVGENEWLEQADEMLSLYYDRGMLTSVDGRPFVEAVEEQIMAAVAGLTPDAAAPVTAPAVESPAATATALSAEMLDEVTSVRWIDPRRSVGGFTIGASTSMLPTTAASKTFNSNNRWRLDMFKHQRVKHDPSEKYSTPVASSMDIGWDSKRPGTISRAQLQILLHL